MLVSKFIDVTTEEILAVTTEEILGHTAYRVYNLIVVPYTFFPKRTPQLQGRNEVRWCPGQQTSLAPACLNLKSFGSKCTASKKVLVTLLGLFGAPAVFRRPGNCAPLSPLVTALPSLQLFRNNNQQ